MHQEMQKTGNLYSGGLTLKSLLRSGDCTVLHILSLDLRNGTGHRTFLLHAITDNDHLIEKFLVLFEHDVNDTGHGMSFLRGKSDAGEYNHGTFRDTDGIFAVNVSDGAVAGSLFEHACPNHRRILLVCHRSCHLYHVLSKQDIAKETQAHQRQNDSTDSWLFHNTFYWLQFLLELSVYIYYMVWHSLKRRCKVSHDKTQTFCIMCL